MLKTLTYLAILALLGGGIYFFILRKTDNPYGAKEAGFNIKDTGNIGKIFIAAATGDAITVERKPTGWVLNGKYKPLPGTLDMLMNTLVTQVPLYPVTKNAHDNAIKLLASDGIKVELYDRAGAKMCAFYVGGTSVNNTGTNMLMEGASTPYVVQTPAFTGDLTPRYPIDIANWRDRTVFNIPGNDIKSISVQYDFKPINSYTVSRAGSGYEVKIDPSLTGSLGPLNTGRAGAYINYFTNINCEGFLNGLDSMNSIIKNTKKMSTVDIETMNGTHHKADIYWMPINKRSKNRLTANEDVPDDYDADRLFAIINNDADTVQVQTLTFKKLLRKSYEFYQQDAARPSNQPQGPNPKYPQMPKQEVEQKKGK